MKSQVKLGSNNEVPLPDELCCALNFALGDILFCQKLDHTAAIVLSKHIDQSLTDDEIESAGNLTRVILCAPEVASSSE